MAIDNLNLKGSLASTYRGKRVISKYLKDVRIGLVFSGGGAKGAYQIGAWKALNEFGLSSKIVAVSGSSVGSLNGFMFTFSDYESAEDLWLNHVTPDKFFRTNKSSDSVLNSGLLNLNPTNILSDWLPQIMPIPALKTIYLGQLLDVLIRNGRNTALFSNEGIGELIDRAYHLVKIKTTKMHFSVCTYQFMTQKADYFDVAPWDLICKKALLASSAIPIIYPPVKIRRMHYYDGGCIDNIPIKPLLNSKLDFVIVVNIEGEATPNDLQSRYPMLPIMEIKPFKYPGGMKKALQFNPVQIKELFEDGYRDTCEILTNWFGLLSSGEPVNDTFVKASSYLASKIDTYPSVDGVTLESMASKLRDFFFATGNGFNIPLHTEGGRVYWEDVDSYDGYRLQRNKITRHYRIVDEANIRLSWGSEIMQTYKFWEITQSIGKN